MTFLVPHAALHRRLAEDRTDRLPERLRAVDDEQDPLLGIKATLDQIGEQRGGDGGVLGRALPEPERHLLPVGGDAETDDVLRSSSSIPSIISTARTSFVEMPAKQLLQRRPGAGHELGGDRRLRGRARLLLDLAADRLLGARVTAATNTGQQPLEHHPAERVAVNEVPVGRELHLAGAIHAPCPRATDRDTAAAERHPARPTAVPTGAAIYDATTVRSCVAKPSCTGMRSP